MRRSILEQGLDEGEQGVPRFGRQTADGPLQVGRELGAFGDGFGGGKFAGGNEEIEVIHGQNGGELPARLGRREADLARLDLREVGTADAGRRGDVLLRQSERRASLAEIGTEIVRHAGSVDRRGARQDIGFDVSMSVNPRRKGTGEGVAALPGSA